MKQNEKLLLTSFIFTIFVVWLHAGEPLLSYVPGQVAVPGFFMLSGYLFMKGIPSDDAAAEKEAVRGKLKRRVNTLVIPYLLWNAIYFVIYLVTGRAQIGEIFEAVFLYRCNPVFWYMFQLILITVLAPVIYYIMKKGRRAALILLAAIFTLAVLYAKLPFHYCNEDALFYYCLGAYLSLVSSSERHPGAQPFGPLFSRLFGALRKRGWFPASHDQPHSELEKPENDKPLHDSLPAASLPDDAQRGWIASCASSAASFAAKRELSEAAEWRRSMVPPARCFAISAVIMAAFLLVRSVLPAELRNISEAGYRAAGALAVYFLTDLVYEKKGGIEVRPWMKVNFFVYATHYMIIRIIWALETAAGLNGNQTANVITYLMMPAICIGTAYGLSVIMKKYVPKVYSVLTGGR